MSGDFGDVILPKAKPGFQDSSEVPGEVYQQKQISLSETAPLEKDIILGPLLNNKEGIKRILDICEQLILGHIKGMAASETFHLEGGRLVDITIRKPYFLRMYKGGSMVHVYENQEILPK